MHSYYMQSAKLFGPGMYAKNLFYREKAGENFWAVGLGGLRYLL